MQKNTIIYWNKTASGKHPNLKIKVKSHFCESHKMVLYLIFFAGKLAFSFIKNHFETENGRSLFATPLSTFGVLPIS